MPPATGCSALPARSTTIDDFDREKWLKLHLKTKYYTVRLHAGAFFLPAFLEEMLEEVE